MTFKLIRDEATNEDFVEIHVTGHQLLDSPLLNKGTAFTEDERREFGLLGLLPPHISTVQNQLDRRYENFAEKPTNLEKYIYLVALQDRNETLFYRLLQEHISEMTPIIYTPVVGEACQTYSHNYRRPRGLYISHPQKAEIVQILSNAPHQPPEVIVVTDGERILGLGDLGVGGMGIPIGKLSLYTLCAGIHPATTLPILLDVGTDNQELLNDPLYLGWQHKRIRGQEYDDFIEAFVSGVKRVFPDVLLQWEDFAKDNAGRLLDRYHDQLCTFNDDIQGTGAVTLAGLLAAVSVAGSKISQQTIVILGAGSAASGVTAQIVTAMESEGLSIGEAKSRIWLVDRHGLVNTGDSQSEKFKAEFAQPIERLAGWNIDSPGRYSLADVVRNVHPTVLIGTAAQHGAFTESIVRDMTAHTKRPIIFPLSNPTSKCEALPEDLIRWTDGKALIATGSPFAPVRYRDREITIGQCNNAFIFPGVGLAVIATKSKRVTNSMFVAAARALSELSPARKESTASLFPTLENVREASFRVAMAVGAEAQRLGLAEKTQPEEMEKLIRARMWNPEYLRMRLKRS